ncbi:hypothetical protein VPH35_059788 [Triticum aestivum]|uniref:Uncharacterized protein n=1 Tax=Aegilops tauschii TaxID=37682 RepID=R7WCL3_AEGTA
MANYISRQTKNVNDEGATCSRGAGSGGRRSPQPSGRPDPVGSRREPMAGCGARRPFLREGSAGGQGRGRSGETVVGATMVGAREIWRRRCQEEGGERGFWRRGGPGREEGGGAVAPTGKKVEERVGLRDGGGSGRQRERGLGARVVSCVGGRRYRGRLGRGTCGEGG